MPDEDIIRRCLTELGLANSRLDQHRRLAGADSGSQVFQLVLDGGEPVVLKVTTTEDREPARRELAFYQKLAGQVPVRTPALLGAADGAELTCMLIESVRPSPPADAWTRPQWFAVAVQLGELHRPEVLARADGATWLGTSGWPSSGYATAAAPRTREGWRQLGQAAVTDPLFDQLDRLGAAVAALPACLLHGDCHVANLLLGRADDDLVWTDWQGTTVGRGPEDFALLWSRAGADGGSPPEEEMIAVYAAARGLPADDVLHRAMTAASIRLMLYGWPERLPHYASDRRDRIVTQLHRLGHEWRHAW